MKAHTPLFAVAALFMSGLLTSQAADTVTFSGTIHDTKGNPLGDITLKLEGRVGEESLTRELSTNEKGEFSITVPNGEWKGVPDEIELLERGYFCFPGFEWREWIGNVEPEPAPERPGEILRVWDAENVRMVAVPVQPEIRLSDFDKAGEKVAILAGFVFPDEVRPPEFSGTYQIQTSEDMAQWTMVDTVELSSLVKETKRQILLPNMPINCYFRVARVGPLQVLQADWVQTGFP